MPLVTLDFNGLVYSGSGDFATTPEPVTEDGFIVSNPHNTTFGTLRSSVGYNRHDTNDDTPFAAPSSPTGPAKPAINITHAGGETFDLLSLELDARDAGVGGNIAITGILAGGGTVELVVSLDTINSSQVFTLPDTFRNLTSVGVTGSVVFQFDNIVLRDYVFATIGSDTASVFGGATFLKMLAGTDLVSFASGAFQTNDNVIIDGGDGLDTIALTGGQTFTLGGGTVQNITNFETITLAGGSYNITMADGFLNATQTLTVNASALNSAETLTFNGSAETFGSFVLSGGAGNDTLTGGAGNDEITTGGSGDDLIDGGAGNDVMVGGANNDHMLGGLGNDQVFGSSGVDLLEGGDGNDTLDGGSGNDVVFGGAGDDVISDAGFDDDQMFGGSGNDLMFSFEGNDLLDGGEGDDTMFAGDDDDSMVGGSGNDQMNGGAHNDILNGGTGDDTMIGGLGNDVFIVDSVGDVVTEAVGEGVDDVRTALGSRTNPALVYTLPANVENLTGTSAGAQGVVGNALDNVITMGNAGDLIVLHDGGNDTVSGGGGNDFIYYGATFTSIGDSNDGGAGFDTVGLLGTYTITFGTNDLVGIEKLAMYSAGNPATSVPNNYTVTMNDANVASGASMLVVALSLQATETFVFNGAAETNGIFNIRGGRGNDTITAGAGNDQIFGNLGADTLRGGAGNDFFEYYATAHSTAAAMDQILDFTLGDRINLFQIDADGNGANGNSSFAFIGPGAFTNTAGQVRAYQSGPPGSWFVEADVNGDSIADLVIALTVTGGHTLTAADFIL